MTSLDAQSLPEGYYTSKNFVGSVIGVCLMAISLFLGFSLPVNSLGAINADLGPDPSYSLITTVFTLTSGVALLLVGRLGDIFGRRYFLIAGQTLGLIGSIIAATAKSIPTIIGASVLTGLAAAVQLTFSFVIAELVPNRARPVVNAGIFVTTFPFAAFGAAIAQLFIENTEKGWRWCYYLNIITCGSSVLLFLGFYFPPGWDEIHSGLKRREEVKRFDYGGFVLYSGGLVLVLLGLSWGGSSYAWDSAHVVATLVVGFVALTVFVFYEAFMPLERPLVPMSLLKNRGYLATVGSALVGNMVYFSLSLLWPQEISALFTPHSPVSAGWLAISLGTGVIVGEIFAGLFMKVIGYTKIQLVVCTVMVTAFSGGMACVDQGRVVTGVALTAVAGFAVGYLELITIIMCPLFCEPEDIGLASGFLGSSKQVAGTIATTIYIAILNTRISNTLPKSVTTAALATGLPESSLPDLLSSISAGQAALEENVPGMTPPILEAVTSAMKTAYSQSFRTVFLASIAFGGLAVVAALLAVDVDARLDGRVARRLRGVQSSGFGGSESGSGSGDSEEKGKGKGDKGMVLGEDREVGNADGNGNGNGYVSV